MFEKASGCWDNGGIFDEGETLREVSIYEDETLDPMGTDSDGGPIWPCSVDIDDVHHAGFWFQTSQTMHEPMRYRTFVLKVSGTRTDVIGDFYHDTYEEWVRGIVRVIEETTYGQTDGILAGDHH